MSSDHSANRSRLPLVLLMAGALVSASLLRQFGLARTTSGDAAPSISESQSFSQFNSYTLGLLLGGLRGPLVMTLWSTSETQKSERNLDDINTKIELIRLLQPEFDTVHLFQIWNKAYNLSVQMSNLASKYATILDAVDYANKSRAERPGNINLESALASVYFDKLGNSSEKAYYRERLREESMQPLEQVKFVFPQARREEFINLALAAGADARRYTIRPESGSQDLLTARLRADFADRITGFAGEGVQRIRIAARVPGLSNASMRVSADPVLAADGTILPALARRDLGADVKDIEWHPEHGELAYLVRFEPYPDGVSPYAFAYGYYKRSVALQETRRQKHAQLSERVISSRPALSLKSWSEEEIERGRYAELAQFGLRPMREEESALPLELPASNLPLTPRESTPLIREAIACYHRAADVGVTAVQEYRSHVERYTEDNQTYRSHLAHTMALMELARGDALYLEAVISTGEARNKAVHGAMDAYRRSLDLLSRNVLAFYTPDEIMPATFPPGYGKADVLNSFDDLSAFPPEFVGQTMTRIMQEYQRLGAQIPSEVDEYRIYSERAINRMALLQPLLGNS